MCVFASRLECVLCARKRKKKKKEKKREKENNNKKTYFIIKLRFIGISLTDWAGFEKDPIMCENLE